MSKIRVLNAIPAPDIRAATDTPVFLHEPCNEDVFSPMISTDSTWYPMLCGGFFEGAKDSFCTVVVVDPQPCDQTRLPVNEAMFHNLIAD